MERNHFQPITSYRQIFKGDDFTRKLLLSLLGAILFIMLHGCSDSQTDAGQSGGTPSGTPSPSLADTSPLPSEDPERLASAYFAVFEDLYNKDSGLNGNIDYLALDLSKVQMSDQEDLTAMFQSFCDDNKLTLLLDSSNGLSEKGYIKNMAFEKGLLIKFEDVEVSDMKIVTKAEKWRSGDGADGATYTLSLKGGSWMLKDITDSWIS
jgi:hypothetical protein